MATSKAADGLAAMHTALTRKLPGVPSKEIKNIATMIGQLTAQGLKVDDAFPEGTVMQDTITVAGNLDMQNVLKLGNLLSIPGRNIRGVTVFPQGIPMQPDFMRVTLKFGR